MDMVVVVAMLALHTSKLMGDSFLEGLVEYQSPKLLTVERGLPSQGWLQEGKSKEEHVMISDP